jgi:hypothetical protein
MPAWPITRQTMVALVAALVFGAGTASASATNPYSGSGADVSYPQ